MKTRATTTTRAILLLTALAAAGLAFAEDATRVSANPKGNYMFPHGEATPK